MDQLKKIKIYFVEDNESIEREAIDKGYRTNVYVEIEDGIRKINVLSLERLTFEFKNSIKHIGYYQQEVNLVLVKEVSKKEIINTLEKLIHGNFYKELKILQDNEIPNNLIQIT